MHPNSECYSNAKPKDNCCYAEIFFKYCFFNRAVEKQKLLQRNAWKFQCVVTLVVYGSSLAVIASLTNFVPGWNYDGGIIFNNIEVNVKIFVAIIMGILSLLMSFKPDIIDAIVSRYVCNCFHYGKFSIKISGFGTI